MGSSLDIAILGGGPAGYAAALRAAALGRKPTIFEKNEVGGVCLNRGCIPTKAALEVALSLERCSEVSPQKAWEEIKDAVQHAVRVNVQGLRSLLKKRGVEIVNAKVSFSGKDLLLSNGMSYSFKNALICTGSVSVHPEWAPLNVLSEENWFTLERLPESLAIVGGGVAGVELATIFAKLTQVTLIEMAPQILPFLDQDLSGTVERELKKRKVKVIKNFAVKEIVEGSGGNPFKIQSQDGQSLEAHQVIIAVGRKAQTESLNLEKAEIRVDERGFVKVDDYGITSNASVYAAGDVTGQPFLAHKAYVQAEVAIEHMSGNSPRVPQFIPYAVFGSPEVAGAGFFEKDRPELATVKVPVRVLGRAHASRKIGGEIKLLFDRETLKVEGIHLISHNASEIISSLTPALEKGITVEELAASINVHPTFSEILREAALSAIGKPFHG